MWKLFSNPSSYIYVLLNIWPSVFNISIYIYTYIYILYIIQIHAKIGSIKDRNNAGLTEAEDIRKRWQEYREELYKKDLHYPDNHNGVITHLEADIRHHGMWS